MIRRRFRRFEFLIFGPAFACCGLIFLLFMAQRTDLECRRVETSKIDCQVRASLIGLLPTGSREVNGLTAAEIGESCDSDGCTYRVELETVTGTIPLTSYYSSGDEAKRELANQINRFIQEDTPQEISVDTLAGEGFGLIGLIPVLFVLIGAALFIFGFISAWR